MRDLNKIKKHLGIRKKELILLAVYRMYKEEFDDVEEACEFVLNKIENEKELIPISEAEIVDLETLCKTYKNCR